MMKKTAEKVVAKAAYQCAKQNVNAVCTWLFYQPKVPNQAKKLRKF